MLVGGGLSFNLWKGFVPMKDMLGQNTTKEKKKTHQRLSKSVGGGGGMFIICRGMLSWCLAALSHALTSFVSRSVSEELASSPSISELLEDLDISRGTRMSRGEAEEGGWGGRGSSGLLEEMWNGGGTFFTG